MNPEVYLSTNAVTVSIDNPEIKTSGAVFEAELIEKQGLLVASKLVSVPDYFSRFSGCSDGRGRDGLFNGQSTDARFTVFGASSIYYSNQMLLINGITREDTDVSVIDRGLKDLKAAGFKPGMHASCAAANNIQPIMGIISQKSAALYNHAKTHMGELYSDEYMNLIINNAKHVYESSKFENFSEHKLFDLLVAEFGEQEAMASAEKLLKVDHEELIIARLKKQFVAVDSTAVFNESVVGKGAYIFNDSYAQQLENLATSNIDAVIQQQIARHAREAIIWSTLQAVPNPEIREVTIY